MTNEATTTICHIAFDADVDNFKKTGNYYCASLEHEGFIHCCKLCQLSGVISRYYENVDDVQLMRLDIEKLDMPIIFENTMGGTELFPHIYGSINKDAVKSIEPFGLTSLKRIGLFS